MGDGSLRQDLRDALSELVRRGRDNDGISDRGFVFGARVIELAGRSGRFFEGRSASALELGKSVDWVKRARRELVAAGVLVPLNKPGPGLQTEFAVRAPADAVAAKRARVQARTKRGADLRRGEVDTEGEPASGTGQICPEHGADLPRTRGESAHLVREESKKRMGGETGPEDRSPRRLPSVLDSRSTRRRAAIEEALSRVDETRRDEARARLEIIGDAFEMASKPTTAGALYGFLTTTKQIPTDRLRSACCAALESKSFLNVSDVVDAAKRQERERRKARALATRQDQAPALVAANGPVR